MAGQPAALPDVLRHGGGADIFHRVGSVAARCVIHPDIASQRLCRWRRAGRVFDGIGQRHPDRR